jgi:hypothetical protein
MAYGDDWKPQRGGVKKDYKYADLGNRTQNAGGGKPNPPKKNTKALEKMQASSERSRTRGRAPAIQRGKDLTNRRRAAAAVPEEDNTQSFMEMLNQALSMTGGGSSDESNSASAASRVDFSGQRNDLQGRANAADASIAAMYKQLQDSYAGQAPGIKQSYDQAGQGIAANGATATSNVNDAYDNARQGTTEQLAALGIGDAAGNLAGRGGNAQRDQEMAGREIAQATQGAQNQNTTNGQAASTYNTEMGQVAGLTGAATRGRLQGSLSEKMAMIGQQEQSARAQEQEQRAQARSQSASDGLAQAMRMAGMQMDEQRYNQTREDNLSMTGAKYAQDQQQFLAKQQQDTADAQGRAGVPQQVLELLAQNGIEPNSPEYARTMSAYAQMLGRSY